MASLSEIFDRMNPTEIFTIAIRPTAAFGAKAAYEQAFAETARRFPNTPKRNTAADAFRHCYWSALLTSHLGFLNAKAITDAHEAGPDSVPAETTMDLHNNMQGMLIGIRNKRASDERLSELCMQALRDKRLVVLDRTLLD